MSNSVDGVEGPPLARRPLALPSEASRADLIFTHSIVETEDLAQALARIQEREPAPETGHLSGTPSL